MGCLVLGAMLYCMTAHLSYVYFGLQGAGDQILHLSTSCAPCGLGRIMAAARGHFKFSTQSSLNDHDIGRNDSSSPNLPPSMIYNENLGIRVTTTVVRFKYCSFETHSEAGRSIAIGWNCSWPVHSKHRMSYCINDAKVAAKHCLRCFHWLQSLAAYCYYSACTCNAQSDLPHNDVIEAHCYVVNIGRTDHEQRRSWIYKD